MTLFRPTLRQTHSKSSQLLRSTSSDRSTSHLCHKPGRMLSDQPFRRPSHSRISRQLPTTVNYWPWCLYLASSWIDSRALSTRKRRSHHGWQAARVWFLKPRFWAKIQVLLMSRTTPNWSVLFSTMRVCPYKSLRHAFLSTHCSSMLPAPSTLSEDHLSIQL